MGRNNRSARECPHANIIRLSPRKSMTNGSLPAENLRHLAELPVINQPLVEALQLSISKASYLVNPDQVAEKIMLLARQHKPKS